MITLQIGENEPFKLTKDSGYRMTKAIVAAQATVVSAIIDTTCPPTYINVRFQVARGDVEVFQYNLPEARIVEIASGS